MEATGDQELRTSSEFQSRLDEIVFEKKTIRDLIQESYNNINKDRESAQTTLDWLMEDSKTSPAKKIGNIVALLEIIKRMERSGENLMTLLSNLQRYFPVKIKDSDEDFIPWPNANQNNNTVQFTGSSPNGHETDKKMGEELASTYGIKI